MATMREEKAICRPPLREISGAMCGDSLAFSAGTEYAYGGLLGRIDRGDVYGPAVAPVVVTESMLVAVIETTRARVCDVLAVIGVRSPLMWAASLTFATVFLTATPGCQPQSDRSSLGQFEGIWGSRGISDGRFQKPRAMAIDGEDRIYVVDMTARVQVFDREGCFLRGWSTPDHQFGKPTGISIGIDGRVLVADTHYYQVLIYTPEGRLVQTIGGKKGEGPGEFGLVTDAVQDSTGSFYVAEYGEYDRIQKFSPSGDFVLQWGGHGSEPGQFIRPQNLAIDEKDRIWVADACNHRIQVFDGEGSLLQMLGTQGGASGQLHYPYDLALTEDGTLLVSEFGNHRIQRWDRAGEFLGTWGSHGRGEGQLFNPWALVEDSTGAIHVLDTNNHRVQVVHPYPAWKLAPGLDLRPHVKGNEAWKRLDGDRSIRAAVPERELCSVNAI